MRNILITGGKGQLATSIKEQVWNLKDYNFVFVDFDELDITKAEEVNAFFRAAKPDFCVNCAAYTAVDRAESEKDKAESINTDGAMNLAIACQKNETKLIHISTDFVFDGNLSRPYTEKDEPNPIGVYGLTKSNGEKAIKSKLKEYFILRTAWLYSEYGTNFLKTMLRLGEERKELSIVNDQFGTPTYAGDLAKVILKIITEDFQKYGTYHYSNEGVTSWYDFAKAIFEHGEKKITLRPIPTEEFPTAAKRPAYSALDKSKIKAGLDIQIAHWRDRLHNFLNMYLKSQ